MRLTGFGIGGLLMLLTVGPLLAQFSQLTTNDDGQRIYFTSPLLLKSSPGQGAMGEGRLYRLAPEGVSLVAERGNLVPPAVFIRETGLQFPQVSSDGSVVAFTFVNLCAEPASVNGPPCPRLDYAGVVRGSQSLDLGRGMVQLSRNGRWALLTAPCCDSQSSTLIDLTTGERNPVPNPASVLWSVASDGTILIEQRDKDNHQTYGLWKQGRITPIVTANVAPVALSDDARVALLSWPSGGYQGTGFSEWMGVKDLISGREIMFFEQPDVEWAVYMGMSRNGSRILYRRMPEYSSEGDAYIYDASVGKNLPILLPAGELVSDGTLSASGEFAVLATTTGRLVRVNLTDNALTTLIPATPYVNYLDALVPGSLFHLKGTLTGPMDGWSGKIVLGGQSVPLVYTRPGDVAIQVPWNQVTGTVPFRLDLPNDSPFIQNQSASVVAAAPLIETVGSGERAILGLKIIKGDWSGLVDKPPVGGDIIHLYMTGLGEVTSPTQTGVPTPPGSLFRLTGKVACGFNASGDLDVWDNWAAETLFAGLAPGTTGLYQVSLRLPANSPSEIDWIVCQVLTANGYRSTVIDGGHR